MRASFAFVSILFVLHIHGIYASQDGSPMPELHRAVNTPPGQAQTASQDGSPVPGLPRANAVETPPKQTPEETPENIADKHFASSLKEPQPPMQPSQSVSPPEEPSKHADEKTPAVHKRLNASTGSLKRNLQALMRPDGKLATERWHYDPPQVDRHQDEQPPRKGLGGCS